MVAFDMIREVYSGSMTIALYTHPDMLDHHPGDGHAERSERLTAVLDALADDGRLDLESLEAPLAEAVDLMAVHPGRYVDAMLAAAPAQGRIQLDPDTFLSSGSIRAARRAAGGAMARPRAASCREVAPGLGAGTQPRLREATRLRECRDRCCCSCNGWLTLMSSRTAAAAAAAAAAADVAAVTGCYLPP
jgi:hypothetical protein